MEKINVVPNPYVVTNPLDKPDLQNPLDRGPRRIYFNHLPKGVKNIYNFWVSCHNIASNASIDDGIEYWV